MTELLNSGSEDGLKVWIALESVAQRVGLTNAEVRATVCQHQVSKVDHHHWTDFPLLKKNDSQSLVSMSNLDVGIDEWCTGRPDRYGPSEVDELLRMVLSNVLRGFMFEYGEFEFRVTRGRVSSVVASPRFHRSEMGCLSMFFDRE